jgi:hypothetical protein
LKRWEFLPFIHLLSPYVTFILILSRYFIGDTVVVRAIKTIAKGEMVNENYGPIYSLKPRKERRKVLKERYWFDCQCLPCIENWPLDKQIPTDALKFRCSSKECAKPLLIGTDILNPFITCPHCKTITNILKVSFTTRDTNDRVADFLSINAMQLRTLFVLFLKEKPQKILQILARLSG